VSIKALVERAKQDQLSALALTDFGHMYGAIDFFKECQNAGIKPILGIEIGVAPFSCFDKKKIADHATSYPLILLAKGRQGYKNLCKIASIASIEGFYYNPRVDRAILEKYSKDLICLSGPAQSYLAQMIIQEREKELQEEIKWALSIYGDCFYLEIERHQMSLEKISKHGVDQESWLHQRHLDYIGGQEKVTQYFLQLSKEQNIPYVATNDIRYLHAEDWKVHEILINIQSGHTCELVEKDSYGNVKRRIPNPKRKVMSTHELYFKSSEQMEVLFSDLPQAIENTHRIAEKCTLTLDFKTRYYPIFTPPHLEGKPFDEKTRIREAEKFLRALCEDAVPKRYNEAKLAHVQRVYPNRNPLDVVRKRLEYEFEIIISKGMSDYLLIVYDFIAWAKAQNIPVGPGRGSGAGSIILYLIGITDIEPLRFQLFFERFINPERVSYPDIDVDICMDRRCEVIDYTLQKYGREKVAQIITFGTMKAKMGIRDVGRVLSVPLAKVNKLAKLVPEDPTITLQRALEIDPQIRAMEREDEEVKRLLEFAQKLEGSIRSKGIHAAGLIICGDPLTDHVPLCLAKGSDMAVTQYAMKPLASVGMLKIDFLGLKTLTSIQKTVDAIQTATGKTINWVDLPLDDEKTFRLLNQGKTQGVFQLESSGMQELAKQLSIDKFEEIIAVGALYRPGPMEMIPAFIDRKHKRASIEVDHPMMEEIIKETYGIMVYQEQVMQIAQKLADYSLGEGDVLRRAMGKKDRREMARQREKFQKGALANGIDRVKAIEIFDKIEKFASYGFNKSHAAAYGYLSYVTAFLKANYPKEWLAALMTCDRDDLSKVAKHIREAKSMEIKILPPDINEADLEFRATSEGIRFAMSGIKGVGKGAVDGIVKERRKNGPFRSIGHLFQRLDRSIVGKKTVESLIEAGSFDFMGSNRHMLLSSVASLFERACREQKEKARGVMDFFSHAQGKEIVPNPDPVHVEVSKERMLAKEKELLGFYLTGHPMDAHQERIAELGAQPFHEIRQLDHRSVCRAAFIVEDIKVRVSSKTKRKFAILTISDGSDRLELPIWPDLYEAKTELFCENNVLFAVLQVDREHDFLRLKCLGVEELSGLNENHIEALENIFNHTQKRVRLETEQKEESQSIMKKLYLTLDADRIRFSQIVKLKELFHNFAGNHPIDILFHAEQTKVGTLEIESQWGVELNGGLKAALESLTFIQSFSFEE